MNTDIFIARRLLKRNPDGFSGTMAKIAITAVALGMCVMILSIAIVTGFKREISEKVLGFGGHIQISRFDSDVGYSLPPISSQQAFLTELSADKRIRHVQTFAHLPGILHTGDDIHGIVLKGIGSDFDWSFFTPRITRGKPLEIKSNDINNGILISAATSNLLNLDTSNVVRMYFIIDNQVRARRFHIAGIYETGLEEFDRIFAICDMAHIQRLNGWEQNEVAGFEVLLHDFDHLDEVTADVYTIIDYYLEASSIRQLYPQIFDWLALQDMNVIIILTLMVMVAVITMISSLLIIILERTNTIGILKAMGYQNKALRRVFLTIAAAITLKGLFWGNLIGLGLALLQQHTGLITLPQESYYVSTVPVQISVIPLLLLNLGTMVVCVFILVIPTMIISSISPTKTIRYE